MNDVERRLADGLRARAEHARAPRLSTAGVLARVDVRRRRRQQRRAIGAAVLASTLVVGLALSLPALRRRAGGNGDTGATGAASSIVRPLVTTAASVITATPPPGESAGSTVSSPAPRPLNDPATTIAPVPASYAVRWDHLVGTTASGWTLVAAVAWPDLRTSGWPTPYLRTSTWAAGAAGPGGRYLVVQSQIDSATLASAGATVPVAPTAAGGARQLTAQVLDGVVTVSWTEQVAGRGLWTTAVRGWGVDDAMVVDAARTAVWDDTAERWTLSLPQQWSLQSWPNTGAPREVVLRYARSRDGASYRVALADAPGRFGADLVTLAMTPGEHTAVDVGGRVGYATRASTADPWQVVWPETDRLVARIEGPAGMELADVVAMVARLDPSSLAIATGS